MLGRIAIPICCLLAVTMASTPAFAQAEQSKDNLKMLVLAMRNYHDVHGHFPPASVLGPDGKTPHSWRVELLPYLGQQALFDRYKMKEPWDSPNNKEVLAEMPDAFRYPNGDRATNDSAYYVLVGPGTAFEGKRGTKLQDFTDGTSNTILIVEAKRNIPWTKPDDIPYDPKKPVPKLGGYDGVHFWAAGADGAVHLLDQLLDEETMRHLIQRNDRQKVEWPQ